MRAKNASGAAREEPQEKSLIDKPWRKKRERLARSSKRVCDREN